MTRLEGLWLLQPHRHPRKFLCEVQVRRGSAAILWAAASGEATCLSNPGSHWAPLRAAGWRGKLP